MSVTEKNEGHTFSLSNKVTRMKVSYHRLVRTSLFGMKTSVSVCHYFAKKRFRRTILRARYKWGTNLSQTSPNKDKVAKNIKPVKLLFYNNLTGFVCVVLRCFAPAIYRCRN